MKTVDKMRFYDLLVRMAGMYRRQDPLSAEVVEEYYLALEDLKIEQLEAAYGEMKKTKKDPWFPVPGELREAVPSSVPYLAAAQLSSGDPLPNPEWSRKCFALFVKRNKGEITQEQLESEVKKLQEEDQHGQK